MRFISLITIIALAALTFVSQATAQDSVILSDGTQVEGEIIRELDGNIWLLEKIGSVEIERFYSRSQISEVVRNAPTASAPTRTREPEAERQTVSGPGVPKAAVISLEGTVGIQMTAKTLRDILPTLERELGTDGTGIVVFKINSGGGLLLEIQRLSDVIHEEYKPRFRVVAWIESAISAAAMTAHCIEEIYFMPRGNYGACTGWSGALQAVSGRGLEEVLYAMEKISERGNYDYRIMRAMQISVPLRATIDDRTGEVSWFQTSDAGEELVNPGSEILTFNSDNAHRYRFSRGTASSLEELTELLQVPEIEWVGRVTAERIYPISKAEAEMIRFRENVTEDEARLNEYLTNYNISLNAANGARDEVRGALVGRARQHLRNIERMVKRNPNFGLLNFNLTEDEFEFWLEEQDEMLRDIARGP
ncbi:MAG: hypothetical protein AAGI53_06225 [Planctomycetota bacterium]